VAQAINFVTAI